MHRERRVQVSDRVREACAWVAGRARQVAIEPARIEPYAATLSQSPPPGSEPETELVPGEGDREARAAFVVCLDAVNFDSGWRPTIRKRPGRSGYLTIAAALGQDAEHPLMADFAASLRDVGAHLAAEHGGSFAALVDSAAGSAPALADTLAGWEAFADVSLHEGREVPSSSAPRSLPPTSTAPASPRSATSAASPPSPTTSSPT